MGNNCPIKQGIAPYCEIRPLLPPSVRFPSHSRRPSKISGSHLSTAALPRVNQASAVRQKANNRLLSFRSHCYVSSNKTAKACQVYFIISEKRKVGSEKARLIVRDEIIELVREPLPSWPRVQFPWFQAFKPLRSWAVDLSISRRCWARNSV